MSDSVRPHRRQPIGLPIHGILQARILEWVAISFSNAWKEKVKVKSLSRVRLLATPWTAAYQAPPSMDFPGKSTGVGCHYIFIHSPATGHWSCSSVLAIAPGAAYCYIVYMYTLGYTCHFDYGFSQGIYNLEREKQILHINAYMWNLEKWYKWT